MPSPPCVVVAAVLLSYFFVVFLLPQRVERDPRLARGPFGRWGSPGGWWAGASPRTAEDTMLGVFGPLGLLAILGMLSVGVIACYMGLFWSAGARFGVKTAAPLSQDL